MREWYFQVMGQELGPFSAVELKTKVESGQIQRDTMIRRGADGKWLFAERVKGLLPTHEPEPPVTPLPIKRKSSATMPVLGILTPDGTGEPGTPMSTTMPLSSIAAPQRVISISLEGDEDSSDSVHAPSVEFYDFVGFREAISPVLHSALRQYLNEHHLTMTQVNRRALAALISRPELAHELMITNMAVIPQQVNEKSNADGKDSLSERERAEHATFRVTIFNTSMTALDVTQGEFLPEAVETRDYREVGTKVLPALDHKGHVPISLVGCEPHVTISTKLNITVQPLTAMNLIVWFRGTDKPSLTKIRGQLRLNADGEVALSESFTIIMHGDSP